MLFRSGKTDGFILNPIGYYVDYTPAPIMCMEPTIAMGYEKQLAEAVYHFVCAAEQSIQGSKRGQERKEQVLAWVHEIIPVPLRIFVTRDMIENLIEAGVDRMKEELARRADITIETDSNAGAGGAEVDGDETR